ncbi:hypothetical protein L1887_25667 [Cichorium endivia]|nr:hypothetical protein L1887_25667 [Cichorium endivia]
MILRDPEFKPIQTIHICYVPDEEIDGFDGMAKTWLKDGWGVSNFVMNTQLSEAAASFDVRLPPTVDPDLLKQQLADE